MRAKMLAVTAPPDAIDVVGTGGDASGSFNISTCAAFIVAGAGVPVAKHGNRALSSKSGAADVLGALGVKIDLRPGRRSAAASSEAGIGFMFAPAHHPAMKNVGADPRRARHPHDLQSARPAVQSGRRQAADGRRVLAALDRADGAGARRISGPKRVWVVHGSDGLDEITTSGPTQRRGAGERRGPHLRDHRRRTSASRASKPEALRGGDAEHNAAALLAVLKGKHGRVSRRRAAECGGGADRRRQGQGPEGRRRAGGKVVDSGEAEGRLDRLIAVSNKPKPRWPTS